MNLPSPLSVDVVGTHEKTKWFKVVRAFVIYLILAALLYFALRNAPLNEIWNTLQLLQFWQIALLFGLNLFIYACWFDDSLIAK